MIFKYLCVFQLKYENYNKTFLMFFFNKSQITVIYLCFTLLIYIETN